MASSNIYAQGLGRNDANFVPLSPLTFLERSARVHPDHPAVIHGELTYSWSESYDRCRSLASALSKRGIGKGDTVSVMAFNGHEIFEAHFGVPMIGAVLHAINTRLDATNIAFMLDHCESKFLIADREFSPLIQEALTLMTEPPPPLIHIDDPEATGGELIGEKDYEALLAEGDSAFQWSLPEDEWYPVALGYTSGTTGNPKGVVTHHRGAYLNAISNIMAWDMPKHAVYLWTLPMFHCNGWCFPWTLSAISGTNVCLRRVDVHDIYRLIASHGVTHYCGAPIVHNMLIKASEEVRAQKQHQVSGMIAAAPPPAALLKAMNENGFDITHVYGLTETYGPSVFCEWHRDWDDLPIEAQAHKNSRQGVRYHMLEGLMVADPETMEPVPADGESIGEIFMRGNNVMMGYLKNPSATKAAFKGGWFHSGDLGVVHPDGYVQIRDRSKDIIISGGENISSIELQDILFTHPSVEQAAVVAAPDSKWGETPCAFVSLLEGIEAVSESDIKDFCRQNMAGFKVPKYIVFGELPKTSTGKVQKFKLRERAKELVQKLNSE